MRMSLLATASAAFLALAACGASPDGAQAADEPAEAAVVKTAPAQPMTSADRLAEAKAFLAENGARAAVVTTDSGLQYEVIEAGPSDGAHPYPGQFICAHYRGVFLDGTEFDSSYARGVPAAFPSDRLIAGWVEALAMMRPGDIWKLYIHPDLAYGAEGRPSIPGNSALVFDIELLRLLDGPPSGPDCSVE